MEYDLNYVKENRDALIDSVKKRNLNVDIDRVITLYDDIKRRRLEVDKLRHKRNETSKNFKSQTEEDKKEMKELREKVALEETEIQKETEEAYSIFLNIPNILSPETPIGRDSSGNKEIKKVGEIKKFDFEVKSHDEFALEKSLLDMKRAAKVTGSRFYYLKGKIVKLALALEMYAIEKLSSKGYIPVEPPFMLKKEAFMGIAAVEDFEDALYKVTGKEDDSNEERYLIATAEHPLGTMFMNEAIPEDDLPIKFVGVSPSFRREAGSHGKDTKGIFRVHQFDKIEQFIFCKPEDSDKFLKETLSNSEEIWQELEIPYHILSMCSGDISRPTYKKFDIEGYMYAQKEYRELGSFTNCTDWQSRRLNIKYVDKHGEKRYLHTVNGTAIPIERALVAILEAYQTKDGKLNVPKPLQKYCGFESIE